MQAHTSPSGILVVEDDARVAASLRQGLSEAGYDVRTAAGVRQARAMLEQARPAVLVLDLGLPDGDGADLLRGLRGEGDRLPVIILTARDAVSDRVSGLDAGADDYLVKPFSFAELLARIRARLRTQHEGGEPPVLRVADLEIDRLNRTVRRGGAPVELTAREFDLLCLLAQSAGYAVSRDMLAREVWRITKRFTSMDNVIDVHVSHLREKLDRDRAIKLLRTVRGVGFMLSEAPP